MEARGTVELPRRPGWPDIMVYHQHIMRTRLFEDSLRLYLGEQRSQRAQAGPTPLPLLRDPVPVEGIDLDDTSRLWDLK
jgi:hypothetical protein